MGNNKKDKERELKQKEVWLYMTMISVVAAVLLTSFIFIK